MRKPRRGLRLVVDWLDDRRLLSGASGLTPADITAAYGLNAINFSSSSGSVKGDGTGEMIALIEMYHDPNLASDLATFDQKYSLPAPPSLNVINQAGSQTDTDWGQEESLDVEWAHAIAPGANILVVEAPPGYTETQALQNLMAAVQTASQTPGVSVVSMSWGFNEFPDEMQYDSYFQTPGITYVAASGDTPGAEYPAASPNGTTLINDLAASTVTTPLPSPTTTPTPTPTPTSTQTPTPTGGKHRHRHKAPHAAAHKKAHAPAAHTSRVVNQGHPAVESHTSEYHRA